ncbi:MAG: hypothetical protein EA365_11080 [Gloeocapsa sp. DLM2.Bin57]|jgi:hypothetical protein|nr:MAG: hypothetical protein EA365_11080 [Gloeocapsa sp. DLM2.Bin57]
MLKSSLGKIVPLLLVAYVAVGDSFLPANLGQYSSSTRQKINNYLVSIFPDKEIESPYGRNDEIIRQIERK